MERDELKNYLKMQTELNRLEEVMKKWRLKLESPKTAVISEVKGTGGERTDFTVYLDNLILLQEMYDKRAKAIIQEQIPH